MKSNKINDFVTTVIPAGHLVEGVDFEVISYISFDMDIMETVPINTFYHIDTLSLVTNMKVGTNIEDQLRKIISSRNDVQGCWINKTPIPEHAYLRFYRLKSPLDYDTAISLGFGIVRLLQPYQENELWLYSYKSLIENEGDIAFDRYEEIMSLKCYLQLIENGKFHDPTIMDFIKENLDFPSHLFPCKTIEMLESIFMSLDKHKGELILLR